MIEELFKKHGLEDLQGFFRAARVADERMSPDAAYGVRTSPGGAFLPTYSERFARAKIDQLLAELGVSYSVRKFAFTEYVTAREGEAEKRALARLPLPESVRKYCYLEGW